MKITFVTQNYPPFTGGIETHVSQVADALSSRHQVTVAAMNFSTPSVPKKLAMLASNLLARSDRRDRMEGAVRVVSIAPQSVDRLKMLPLVLRAVPKLQRWFYHQIYRLTHPFYAAAFAPRLAGLVSGADVVHSMGASDLGWATESVSRRFGVPVVCTPFVHPAQWGDGPDDVAFYRRCAAIVGLVKSDRDYLASLGVPDATLHEIGVSPSLPASIDNITFRTRAEWGSEPLILFIGRMVRAKGMEAVLNAAPAVWARFPTARFVFIGPGADTDTAVFRGCDDRIRYLGRVAEQEKAEALAACDVFCMPSISEILPTVYLEAWALGKPVVGGTAHGLSELIEGNDAGIVAAQNPEAVADAITRILADRNLAERLGTNGKNLVRERYSVDAVSGALEQLYKSVAAN